jgi:hypothetical protein
MKVGIIAMVGFAIGVAWPRIAGVRLGPKAPAEFASAQSAATTRAEPPSPTTKVEAPSASLAVPQPASQPSAAASAAKAESNAAPKVAVSRGAVLSCKTSDGESKRGKECGSLAGLDALLVPRIKKLAACTGAAGKSGKVSGVVTVDFGGNKLGIDVGKSSTVEGPEAIKECLRSDIAGVSVASVDHEHSRYVVVYTATLTQPEGAAAATASATPAAAAEPVAAPAAAASGPEETVKDGAATVAWEVALVRDVPKSGQIVAHLPHGTKVKVLASKDGWFKIQSGAQEGWVYRGAIGR